LFSATPFRFFAHPASAIENIDTFEPVPKPPERIERARENLIRL
jgi:hypothetical protein